MKNKNIILVAITTIIVLLSVAATGILFIVYKDITGDKQENSWEKLVNSKENTVIYFGRKDCTWCVKFKPILEALKEKYGVEYEYIDTDIVPGFEDLLTFLGNDYNTFSTPYTVIVKKGKKIGELFGYTDIKTVFDFYQAHGLIEKDVEYEEIEIDEVEIMIESDQESYPHLNILKYDDFQALLNNNQRNILIVGQSTCGYCAEYKPILNEIAKQQKVTINYIDITILTQKQYDDFTNSFSFFQDNPYWGTPLTLIIENKSIIDYMEGIKSETETITYYESLELIK